MGGEYHFRGSRRLFIKNSVLAAASITLPRLGFFPAPSWAGTDAFTESSSPLAQVESPFTRDFTGDEIDRPHDLLWHKESYLHSKGGIPALSEEVPVVVVGGGVAGLVAAHRLRDLRPLVLEQASRLGGNSKGERYLDTDYSIGAAYLSLPEGGSETAQLLEELGLQHVYRVERSEEMPVELNGKVFPSFWGGATDPERASEFKAVLEELLRVREEGYPDIPHLAESRLSLQELHALDSIPFSAWVKRKFGNIHPHIEEFFHLYLWSSFGGAYDEISAAQALNFLAVDIGGTIAFPGGNAAVTAALHRKLESEIGKDRIRQRSFVIDIALESEGVRVCYEGADGALRSVRARACVVAFPKFIGRHVISGLSQEQSDAMSRLRYRAYLVANVLLKHPIRSPGFDLFLIRGEIPQSPRWTEPNPRFSSDLCFGSWANHDRSGRGVLTFYKPLPYDGANQFLFAPGSHEKHRGKIADALPSLLATLGLSSDSVDGIRMTRWGHALPLAEAGMLSSGHLEKASRPMAGRIFFAQQDNWANPCFETSVQTALQAEREVRKLF